MSYQFGEEDKEVCNKLLEWVEYALVKVGATKARWILESLLQFDLEKGRER